MPLNGRRASYDVVLMLMSSSTSASIDTDEIPDTQVQFTGSWTFDDAIASASENSGRNASFHMTQTVGDEAQYSFQGMSNEFHINYQRIVLAALR